MAAEVCECETGHAATSSIVAAIVVLTRRVEAPHDDSVGEHDDLVGDRRRARVVGDHDDRLTVAVDGLAHQAQDLRPEAESRLPVGSSANRTAGALTSARATATRCCWPPESCAGRWLRRSARPTRSSTLSTHALLGLAAGEALGQDDVLLGAERRASG